MSEVVNAEGWPARAAPRSQLARGLNVWCAKSNTGSSGAKQSRVDIFPDWLKGFNWSRWLDWDWLTKTAWMPGGYNLPAWIVREVLNAILEKEGLLEVASLIKAFLWRGSYIRDREVQGVV